MGPGSGSLGFQGCQNSAHSSGRETGLVVTIIGEFHYFPLPARLLPVSYLTSVGESMRLPSWPGYHRHDLRCSPDSRKVPQTTPGSLHDFYRPHQGLRLFSQGRSLEDSEEYWMSRQVRQHCEILPRWHDGMYP